MRGLAKLPAAVNCCGTGGRRERRRAPHIDDGRPEAQRLPHDMAEPAREKVAFIQGIDARQSRRAPPLSTCSIHTQTRLHANRRAKLQPRTANEAGKKIRAGFCFHASWGDMDKARRRTGLQRNNGGVRAHTLGQSGG